MDLVPDRLPDQTRDRHQQRRPDMAQALDHHQAEVANRDRARGLQAQQAAKKVTESMHNDRPSKPQPAMACKVDPLRK
jgi:hypothetical protein